MLITIRYDDCAPSPLFAERAPGQKIAQRLDGAAGPAGRGGRAPGRPARKRRRGGRGGLRGDLPSAKGAEFEALLTDLARAQSLTGKARASLVSLSRVFIFAALAQEIAADRECTAHLRTLQRDGQSLTEHAGAQAGHIQFLRMRRWA